MKEPHSFWRYMHEERLRDLPARCTELSVPPPLSRAFWDDLEVALEREVTGMWGREFLGALYEYRDPSQSESAIPAFATLYDQRRFEREYMERIYEVMRELEFLRDTGTLLRSRLEAAARRVDPRPEGPPRVARGREYDTWRHDRRADRRAARNSRARHDAAPGASFSTGRCLRRRRSPSTPTCCTRRRRPPDFCVCPTARSRPGARTSRDRPRHASAAACLFWPRSPGLRCETHRRRRLIRS